jgi:hypothetical protein
VSSLSIASQKSTRALLFLSWTKAGQKMVKRWTGPKPKLVKSWTKDGQKVDKGATASQFQILKCKLQILK